MYNQKRILAIARQSAMRRGYVLYSDFNDYMRELICEGALEPVKAGFSQYEIKRLLLENGYHYERRREARFYPDR